MTGALRIIIHHVAKSLKSRSLARIVPMMYPTCLHALKILSMPSILLPLGLIISTRRRLCSRIYLLVLAPVVRRRLRTSPSSSMVTPIWMPRARARMEAARTSTFPLPACNPDNAAPINTPTSRPALNHPPPPPHPHPPTDNSAILHSAPPPPQLRTAFSDVPSLATSRLPPPSTPMP